MLKYLVVVIIIFCSTEQVISQVQIGFKVSPSISTNRVDESTSGIDASSNGSGLRFTLGPVFDFMINQNENYFFSTGLWFSSRRVGVLLNADNQQQDAVYTLQYVVIPITMKLKSQEIGIDKRIYIQFGPTLDIAVSNKQKSGSETPAIVEDFTFMDVGLIMGAGVEWYMGNSTRLSTGITYTRGLVNIWKDSEYSLNNFSIKNDLVSLDVTVIF